MRTTYLPGAGECTVSDDDDSGAVAVEIGSHRIYNDAWDTARRLHAAGSGGMLSGDVSHTHRQILENARIAIRSDPCGIKLYLDKLPTPSGYIRPIPREAPTRPAQHGSGGAPIAYQGPRYGR